MPARVTLTITAGEEVGRAFVFDERATCVVGRASDCDPQISAGDPPLVSRHHCLLDINPPDIRVRDFGSLNGTWVNGEKIGSRAPDQTPQQGAALAFPEHDLQDGDGIDLGDATLRVAVSTPIEPRPKACARCGRRVDGEAGADRDGLFVCRECRAGPGEILRALLERALVGEPELGAIRDYVLVRELGRGGMGAVYLARHARTGEHVALKVMLPQIAADELAIARFLRETENTLVLRHPNVVEFRDAGCCDGTFYFTVEYCAGGTAEALRRQSGGRLPLDEAAAIVIGALHGLEYAHQAPIPRVRLADGSYGEGRGLVHRDLSPENILLADVPKVSDFGLGKAFDLAGLSGLTRSGETIGKPVYMPRQQILNFRESRPEVDVWAAAACLYVLLTGCSPRDFPPGEDVLRVILEHDAVPIRKRDRAVPKPLAKVIDEALVDRPQIRIKTAAELRSALEAAL